MLLTEKKKQLLKQLQEENEKLKAELNKAKRNTARYETMSCVLNQELARIEKIAKEAQIKENCNVGKVGEIFKGNE